MKKKVLASALTTVAVGASVAAVPAAPASAAQGTRSLATVLAADGNRFDRNWNDFDVLDRAVAHGARRPSRAALSVCWPTASTRLTAFLPTDRAFRRLVHDLTGKRPRTERATFVRLASAAGRRHDRAGAALPRGARGDDHLRPGQALRRRRADAPPPGRVVRSTSAATDGSRLQDRDFNDAQRRGQALGEEHQQGQPPDRARHQPRAASREPLIADRALDVRPAVRRPGLDVRRVPGRAGGGGRGYWSGEQHRPTSSGLDPAIAGRLKRNADGLVAAVVQQHGSRRGADARLDGRRGAAPHPDDRSGHLLEPLASGVLGQGRDLRAHPARRRGAARLRRRHRAGHRRPDRPGLPHRCAHLLRRRRPARGR